MGVHHQSPKICSQKDDLEMVLEGKESCWRVWKTQAQERDLKETAEERASIRRQGASYMCVDSGRTVWGRSSGTSASRKESTDLLLRRNGVRRRKLLGEWGICTRALWEGTTVSPGDSQGGTLDRMLGSRSSSGENTGLSIPRRKGSG